MENNSGLLILIGSLGGAFIGFLSSIIITHLNNKSTERKQIRELAFTAGIEDWKARVSLLKVKYGSVYPIHHGILYMLKVSEVLTKKEITPEEISQILTDATSIKKTFQAHLDQLEDN